MKSYLRYLDYCAYLCVVLYCLSALVSCVIPILPATTFLSPLWYVLLFFPKWWAGCLLIVALPCAYRVGRAGVSAVVLFGIAQLFFYGGFRTNLIDDSLSARSLTVVTLNAGEGALDMNRFSSWLKRHPVDVIALQELKREEPLDGLFPANEWHVLRCDKLTVVSRYPLDLVEDVRRADIFDGNAYGMVYVAFDLKYDSTHSIRLMNVHLETPRHGLEPLLYGSLDLTPLRDNFRRRSYEGRFLVEAAKRLNAEVILGDFNMPYESPLYQSLFEGYQDVFIEKGVGFGLTKFTAWHALRIDHVLVDPLVAVDSTFVGEDLGSDHRPLFARLRFP